MSGKESKNNKGEKRNPLLGARALLSRHLSSGSPSPGRLPSLRPARDLTLSAPAKLSGSGKRTFTPNIPSRRIKQEIKDEVSPHQGSGERRQVKGRGRGRGERGRGRGERGKPNIVQASSIFSMGVGPVEKQRIGSSIPSYGSSGGRDSVSSFKVKEERGDVDDEESKRVLKMLQTSGDIDEIMDSESGMAPVQLPLSFHALRVKEREDESIALEADIKVKTETTDVDMADAEKLKKEETLKKPVKQDPAKKETTDESTILSLLSSQSEEEQKLLFLQFPDVLPIKLVSGDEEECKPADETPDEQPIDERKPKTQKKLSLKNASEGYVGKLQLLKSGKARLLLGDVSLDVTMGTPCGFLQDVVSVHTENNRSEMICLGHVKHRLICTPDFERLLTSS
ncbi:DNA-directed RNA polymerase III subunit RPC4-like isoform X1 [Montipora foliosa]|uniref:DNA-directed RNA polymerase III subunit RPC4-like isoform X1 n=1 Tax=Montipora foliosa TaxID=591990 RepID=UPI0035F114F0